VRSVEVETEPRRLRTTRIPSAKCPCCRRKSQARAARSDIPGPSYPPPKPIEDEHRHAKLPSSPPRQAPASSPAFDQRARRRTLQNDPPHAETHSAKQPAPSQRMQPAPATSKAQAKPNTQICDQLTCSFSGPQPEWSARESVFAPRIRKDKICLYRRSFDLRVDSTIRDLDEIRSPDSAQMVRNQPPRSGL
jgi:hypothetical protein